VIRLLFLLESQALLVASAWRQLKFFMAKDSKAEVLNFEELDVGEALKEMTGGRGPDAVIDAVGLEAHGYEIFCNKKDNCIKIVLKP
jgi:NADPH:quinone reductase-like Zn-dependent oxidoreductase